MILWHILKSHKNRPHTMSQVYRFQMKLSMSIHYHVLRFKKLLINLKNFDEDIKDRVKAIILLHSLLEKYSYL